MNPSPPSRPITLHLGLFFDGTGMNLYNSQPDRAPSNVARLFRLYRHGGDSLALYIEGIGTTGGQADALWAQASGRGTTGVAARVAQVPGQVRTLLDEFRAGNPQVAIAAVEVDLFGFSRGAAAARHLANDLQGLQAVFGDSPLSLNFIGLFDTVGAIIALLKGNFSAANADFDGLRLGVHGGMARQVVQLVAADERRFNFPLVASHNDVLLPGDHCDIGGGYPDEVEEKLVLERPFSSIEWAHVALEQSRAWQLASQCLERHRQEWEAQGLSVRLLSQSVDQPFVPKRDIQREKRVRVWVQGERQVSAGLSRISLQMMHDLALRAGVPLTPGQWTLPEALQGIAQKLLARCPLEDGEMALLRRRYIHLSANWNAVLQSDSPLLDSLFINRPTADGVRVVHMIGE